MSCKTFYIFLIIIALFIIIKSDVPVHCTSDQSFGKWKFHVYGELFKPILFNNQSTCGHGYPGQKLIEVGETVELPENIIKTYELELKNDFSVYENGEKVGNWTNVYDQSFIVYYKNSVFYAHYRYYVYEDDIDDFQFYQFYSNCNRTMNGWFTIEDSASSKNNDNQLMGCFFGAKIEETIKENITDNNNDDVILTLRAPKKKISKNLLKSIKMSDFKKIVKEINNSNLTWKAKINQEDLELSFYDYYKKYFDTKNIIFDEDDDYVIEEEEKGYSKNKNLRNLHQIESSIDEIVKGIKNIDNKKNTSNSEKTNMNDKIREPDSHYVTNKDEIIKYINASYEEIDENILPKNWDWRDVGGENYYSEEIIQGGCGSCYIISSISILESHLRIKTLNKDQTKLSVQFPLSCSFYTEGCKGGYPIVLGKFFHDFEIVPAECFEYTQREEKCENVCDFEQFDKKYYVTDYGYIGGFYGAATEVLMMKELRARGPITGNILSPLFFSVFSGGIYSSKEIEENVSKGLNNKSLYDDNIFFSKSGSFYYYYCRIWGRKWN